MKLTKEQQILVAITRSGIVNSDHAISYIFDKLKRYSGSQFDNLQIGLERARNDYPQLFADKE